MWKSISLVKNIALLFSVIPMLAGISGCADNIYTEHPPLLSVSVSSIDVASSSAEGTDIECQIQVKSNRNWTADFRNPLSPSSAIDWVSITPTDVEYPSNTSFSRTVTLFFLPNVEKDTRVCELVFHVLGGEVIVPVKQQGAL